MGCSSSLQRHAHLVPRLVIFHAEWVLADMRQFRDVLSQPGAATNPDLLPAGLYPWNEDLARSHACRAALLSRLPKCRRATVARQWDTDEERLFPRVLPLFHASIQFLIYLLRNAPHIKVAVVSEWETRRVQDLLRQVGLEAQQLHALVSARDDFPKATSDESPQELCQRLYRKAAERCRARDPRSCVVLQAMDEGIEATTRLGMWPVAILGVHGQNPLLQTDPRCSPVFVFPASDTARLWAAVQAQFASFRRNALPLAPEKEERREVQISS